MTTQTTQRRKTTKKAESKPTRAKHERQAWPEGDVWSQSKKNRMRRLKAKQKKDRNPSSEAPIDRSELGADNLTVHSNEATRELTGAATRTMEPSSLQKSFKARLTGSRFRELNEDLYTTTSRAAFKRFSSQPELYEQYHDGFRHQVAQWPVNPVNVIGKWLANNFRKQESCVVADFGCGDAALARKLLNTKHKGKCPFAVHSFDLVASSDLVTACDMANVPLQDKTVDVAVFCLALMGTNLADFVREGHRVLKDTGILKIAEVRSRFESTAVKDDLKVFVDVLDKLGFKCLKTDRSSKMFVMLELKKNDKKPKEKLSFTANPCIYKRR